MSSAGVATRQPSSPAPASVTGPPTPERILDAAEQALRRFGLRRASMSDVARAAGVSRGSVYRYFPDRDALVAAVLARAAERYAAASETAVRRRRTLATQVAEAAVFIREHRDDPWLTLWPTDEDSWVVAPVLAARVEGLVARWVEFWQPFLAGAIERGEVRADLDRRRAAEWIVRVLLSLTVMPSAVVDLDDPDAVRAFVQEFVVRGLAP